MTEYEILDGDGRKVGIPEEGSNVMYVTITLAREGAEATTISGFVNEDEVSRIKNYIYSKYFRSIVGLNGGLIYYHSNNVHTMTVTPPSISTISRYTTAIAKAGTHNGG